MSKNGFLRNFLIKVASLFATVLLLTGLMFLGGSYFGVEVNPIITLTLISLGTLFTLISLLAMNITTVRLQSELKSAEFFAHQLSQGDVTYELIGEDFDDESYLKHSLQQISLYLKEKEEIAGQIAIGDLSAKVNVRSEADSFGKAFQNMIDKLHLLIETEEKRDLLQRSIIKLLNEVKEVASGDLTVKADISEGITGEIAQTFNFMTSELRSLIGQVKDVTMQIGSSSKSISESTEQLMHGSEAQASQILLTTNAITNMARQIQDVSNNASLSASVAEDSMNNARYGTKAVQDIINAMDSIRKQVQETAKRIKKLGERSQEISQIAQHIDDLSDRTSLLALNASLQAAAAGQSGRGFATVAEEVERLAERSNRLTNQISNLTQSIQVETKDVVASMEETIHEVVVGSTLVDKAGQALVEIEQVTHKQADLISSIHESAKEQAKSAEDISNAMENISMVTEMVNVSSKRTADSVKLLVRLSDELRGSISPFKLPDERMLRRNRTSENHEAYIN